MTRVFRKWNRISILLILLTWIAFLCYCTLLHQLKDYTTISITATSGTATATFLLTTPKHRTLTILFTEAKESTAKSKSKTSGGGGLIYENATKIPTLRPTNPNIVNSTMKPSINQSCAFEWVDPFDPALDEYLIKHAHLNCSNITGTVPNVVYLINYDTIMVDFKKLSQILKNGTELNYCEYHVIEMEPGSDKRAHTVFKRGMFKYYKRVVSTDQDIKIECVDTDNTVVSISYFSFVRADSRRTNSLEKKYRTHLEQNKPAETLSILIIGIDSIAKQHFERSMPKTRNFLIKDLGALELNKHNKIGYSTAPNVIPLLTGHKEKEFIDDPKFQYDGKGYWDAIAGAFIWTDAAKRGYRTGVMFDEANGTAFHWLRNGFLKKPVDHYMRTMAVMSRQDKLMRKIPNCYGDEEEVKKLFDIWIQLTSLYNSTESNRTPFFAYSLFTSLTHDTPSAAYAGDEMYLSLLKKLKATNALNNTVIVWFSDHGERYGRMRHTYIGAIETNTPYTFFVFPPWFERKYPDVMKVFKENQNRLTSHWDTYATMRDILDFKGVPGPRGNLSERSISLFREIPEERTCKDAQIPAEFCVCKQFTVPELHSNLRHYLGMTIMYRIWSILLPYAKQCVLLRLKSIENILEEKNTQLVTTNTRNFRVNIRTDPGNAAFEALVRFEVTIKRGYVVGYIARTNMFRGQADCIDAREIRNYCFCINNIPS